MRIHPAVATTLIVVGGLLLIMPMTEGVRCSGGDLPPAALFIQVVSGLIGLIIILIAVVLSVDSRPKPGGSA